MNYYLAPSLVALRDEVNGRWPNRDKSSDGWIGDTSHQARPSDHNPDWNDGGVVRAIDVDVSGIDRRALLKAVIGDDRVWYVISHGIIYSRTYGWAARRYTGSNSHHKHAHISIRHTNAAESDRGDWFDDVDRSGGRKPIKKKRRTRPKNKNLPTVNLENIRDRAKDRKQGDIPGVRVVQRTLNRKVNANLKVDGYYGEKTKAAYRKWQERVDDKQRNGIPGWPDLSRLGTGHFRVHSDRANIPTINYGNVRNQATARNKESIPGVKVVQRALNHYLNADLKVDGYFGGKTRDAYRDFERALKTPRQDGIPGWASLNALGRETGNFDVVR